MKKFIVVLIFSVMSHLNFAARDTNEQCEQFAATEHECNKNPRYMWDSCQLTCFKVARDDDERCIGWAAEGECTKNPGYIQVHCPASCGYAIAWSPWARRSVGLPSPSASSAQDSCGLREDALGAAEIVHKRLLFFLSGDLVDGMTTSAPSEFNGMAGIAEAFMYATRLYLAVLHVKNSNAQNLAEQLIKEINPILSHWDNDSIMRLARGWLGRLDEIADAVYELAGSQRGSSEGTCLAYGPNLYEVAPLFNVKHEDLMKTSHAELTPVNTVLSNNVPMPTVGLGTWLLSGEECYEAVMTAIAAGYRHIDSAQAYRNEREVGDAVRHSIEKGIVTRKDLFLATKVSDPVNAGYEGVKQLIKSQLESLQTDYIDLYMLHSPISDRVKQADTWRALEELYDAGVIRVLGVSNFGSNELIELHKSARIKPMVVQNKMDVYHVGKQIDPRGDDIERTCAELKVKLVAYSSFSAYPFVMMPTHDPIVQYIAAKYKATPAQVILRWIMMKGALIIPRSTNPARLAENMAVLRMRAFSSKDFALLSAISRLSASPMYVPT
eukprot:CAMPEP_0182428340 /NCGR_PEP_ID=MMETSP1167-20130531/22488_1 /TAXON_ID=2988 /ORGANISM="Mallomonas Sp, Strain CCMP3275" /LENGTH=552 /DNA_ID=CAMNT_0024611183 /DNA_START=66 /DNA_END=1724 /DNA_ORIENTATION=+